MACGTFFIARRADAVFRVSRQYRDARAETGRRSRSPERRSDTMNVAGIDVGSVAAKSVVFDAVGGTILGRAVLPTGWNAREAGELALNLACREAGLDPTDLVRVVGTGYGRVSLPFAHKTVTEITCHARAAAWLFPATGTVLDIGGQDSKVISLDERGAVRDFIMNDKCAAGTGRFLQVLSGILDMSLDELGQAADRGTPVSISSMCAVFAESEIVGLLASGVPPANVAAGVFLSIARRMRGLAGRITPHGQCTFSGGLAASPAFCRMLSQELNAPVNVPDQPQLTGALGAALVAAAQARGKEEAGGKEGETFEKVSPSFPPDPPSSPFKTF